MFKIDKKVISKGAHSGLDIYEVTVEYSINNTINEKSKFVGSFLSTMDPIRIEQRKYIIKSIGILLGKLEWSRSCDKYYHTKLKDINFKLAKLGFSYLEKITSYQLACYTIYLMCNVLESIMPSSVNEMHDECYKLFIELKIFCKQQINGNYKV